MGSTAKLFRNGRSQAVRLPKEFRFEGEEVRIRREGEKVVLEPVVLKVAAEEDSFEAVREEAGESRSGSRRIKFADVEAWLKALDAFRSEPFMPEGRQQPEMPPARDIF